MAVVTTTFAPLLCCQPFYILLAPIDEQIQLKCTTKKKAEAQKNGLVNEDAGKRTERGLQIVLVCMCNKKRVPACDSKTQFARH